MNIICLFRRRLRKVTYCLFAISIVLTLSLIVTVQMNLSKRKTRLFDQWLVSLIPGSGVVGYNFSTAAATKKEIKLEEQELFGLLTSVKSKGFMHAEIWQDFCTLNFNSVRQHPLFPWKPSENLNLSVGATLRFDNSGRSWFALRTMGYLKPPLTGDYTFRVKSNSLVKLWIQTDMHFKSFSNLTNIASTTTNNVNERSFSTGEINPKPPSVKLYKEYSHYFEVWIAVNNPLPKNNDVTSIEWKLPPTNDFEEIETEYVSSLYSNNSYIDNFYQMLEGKRLSTLTFSEEEDRHTGMHFPLNKNTTVHKRVKVDIDMVRVKLSCVFPRRLGDEEIRELPYFDRVLLNEAFQKCSYKPSYMKKRKYQRYEAVWHIRYAVTYPYDGSWNVRWGAPYKNQFKRDDRFDGTTFMNDDEARQVVQKFMESLKSRHPAEGFKLVDITNIEKVADSFHGSRYFLEVILLNRYNKTYRLSEFFYLKSKAPQLCILDNLRWEQNVWIHVILNVKNQGAWVLYFISEMVRVLRETGEERVNFIVVDYGNDGIDISREMKRQGIKHYQVIKKTGPFHKTSTINMAASKVTDPNSIVLLMDLHLQFPVNFFEKIRQHTVQGKLAFAPILFRLDQCGRPQTKHLTPSGFWESLGFGIFSIYKSDWDKFGGMNEKEFKNKWGGEDWEMVDRVLQSGIEVDKIRTIGLYHFYHPKGGMWNKGR